MCNVISHMISHKHSTKKKNPWRLSVICLVDNACILHMDDGQCQAQYDNCEYENKRRQI